MTAAARALPIEPTLGTSSLDLQPEARIAPRQVLASDAGEHLPGANVVPLCGSAHVIDYRVSLPLFGRRYYFACFVGCEQRSLERLAEECQRKSWLHTAFTLMAVAVGLATGLMCVLATAYLVKSMMGIDLFEDHFFLHRLFFN